MDCIKYTIVTRLQNDLNIRSLQCFDAAVLVDCIVQNVFLCPTAEMTSPSGQTFSGMEAPRIHRALQCVPSFEDCCTYSRVNSTNWDRHILG